MCPWLIPYIHLRNVVGKVPHYKEVFIDEGQIDVKRILTILTDCKFDGVIIPTIRRRSAVPHPGMPGWPLPWVTSTL